MILCGDDDDDDDDDDDGVHAQGLVPNAAERDAAAERGQSDGADIHVRWPAVLVCHCAQCVCSSFATLHILNRYQLRHINIRFGVRFSENGYRECHADCSRTEMLSAKRCATQMYAEPK